MKLLIGQPLLESTIVQLEQAIKNNVDVDIVIYPEGYLNDNVEAAQNLAKTYNVHIITGYKKPKDRAIIINNLGEIVLDRAKYDASPVVSLNDWHIGFILCDELVLQGISKITGADADLIVHPIGVGMFSDEQFDEWIAAAKKLAIESKAMIIGASHADGTFRDSDISIPIAYCIAEDGSEVFVSKDDTRTILYDMSSGRMTHGE